MSNSTIYKKRWFRVGTAISILVVGIAAMSILAATKEETNKKTEGLSAFIVDVGKAELAQRIEVACRKCDVISRVNAGRDAICIAVTLLSEIAA